MRWLVFAICIAAVLRAQQPSFGDRFGDGTPDFLRLEGANDRDAFRRWFTFLAEVEFFAQPEERPAEITDCSSLIRFAYREALRQHDAAWASDLRLPLLPALPSLAKYAWPHTPLGPALFRVRAGAFRRSDLEDGTFSQFANAASLRNFNTFFISREIRDAQPGDLLFYFRPDSRMPFHSMIVIGASQIRPSPEMVIVYDTGPEGEAPGRIRRRTKNEMLNYPDRQWQPRPGNPIFLGVYRWNILRGSNY